MKTQILDKDVRWNSKEVDKVQLFISSERRPVVKVVLSISVTVYTSWISYYLIFSLFQQIFTECLSYVSTFWHTVDPVCILTLIRSPRRKLKSGLINYLTYIDTFWLNSKNGKVFGKPAYADLPGPCSRSPWLTTAWE